MLDMVLRSVFDLLRMETHGAVTMHAPNMAARRIEQLRNRDLHPSLNAPISSHKLLLLLTLDHEIVGHITSF